MADICAKRHAETQNHVLLARGQESWQHTANAPLRYAVATSGHKLRKRTATAAAADALSATSKPTLGITELVRILISIPARSDPTSRLLTDTQRALLADIRDIVPRGRWFLIADDIHLWDSESVHMLQIMLVPELRNRMSVIKRCTVIATATESCHTDSHTEVLRQFINECDPFIINIPSMPSAHVTTALEHFGATSLSIDPLVLAKLSGGHLQILKDLAEYYKISNLTPPFPGASGDVNIYDIVKRRLTSEVHEWSYLTDSLSVISTIGVQFTRQEAMCLLDAVHSHNSRDELDTLLSLALLNRVGQSLEFQHATVRDAFYGKTGNARQRYHTQFAECLRELHPADYATRAFHLIRGDSHDRAAIVLIQAAIQLIRNSGHSAIDRADSMVLAVGNSSLSSIWYTPLRDATLHWLQCNYIDSLQILDGLPANGPPSLVAEKSYLLADCWMKTLAVAERLRAVDILEEWCDKVTDEFEIWIRLSTLRLVGYILTRRDPDAKQLELEIASLIARRSAHDRNAESYKYYLYRRADALHDPEVAIRRQREALVYYAPRDGVSPSFIEYIRSASNLVGTLTVIGAYSEALKVGREAVAYLSNEREEAIRSVHLANNMLLAQYLSTPHSSDEVISGFESLINNAERSQDLLLLKVNLATILIYDGHMERAADILTACRERINKSYDVDGYYTYYVDNNALLLQYILGTAIDISNLWESLGCELRDMPYGIYEQYAERHAIIAELLKTGVERSVEQLDKALHDIRPVPERGPWTLLARSFLLTDIQYWSDG